MTANTAPAGSASASALSPGQVVGGRFQVSGVAREDALGVVLAARDQKTQRPIALRMLAPALAKNPKTVQRLKEEARLAAQLNHRSILGTYGVGSAPGGAQFVAWEWVDGAPLSKLVEKRRAQGERLSVRGAYNVIAHVSKALELAHQKGTCHGTLRPSVVFVTKSGRVKVGDFAVGRAVVTTQGAGALGESETASLAPEVKAGQEPDARSDIFGLGAILYEMLTGLSPAQGFTPPSKAHPDASPALDQVLLRCLAGDPSQRYATPGEVRDALLPLVADAPEVPPEEDFGIDVDIDIDLASARPPPTAQAAPAHVPRAPSTPGDRPQVGQRVSIHEEFRPSTAGQAPARMSAEPNAATPRVSEVDLKDLLSKITENDAPRWMVVKDKLDHGPFSGRELVNLILKGDVQGDHGLLNMDTGERKKVSQFPEFTEFLAQYQLKKQEEAHKAALVRSEKVEKVGAAAKYLIAAAVVGVLALGGGIFLLTREAANEEEVADAALAELYESGDIQITGSAGILPDPPRRAGGGRRRGGGGGGGAGGLSYEEAMNQAVNIGDVSSGGGERQLTSGDVAGVMNRHINSFFGCVSQELRGGGSLGTVQIDLAIAGDGSVIGASTRQGSPSFQSCVAGRVRRIRFPAFSAPRMGARFSFSVD